MNSANQDYCMRCNQLSSINRTGLCTKCRTIKCKDCGHTWTPNSNTTTRCGKCRGLKKRKDDHRGDNTYY
jgi:predicted Zn-ribbon and HTH transcriptional regulator